MIKYISAIIASLVLTGCFYQVTSAGDVKSATEICSNHGGINHISVEFVGNEIVTCQDEYWSLLHQGDK